MMTEHGPVYRAIERALWASAPFLVFLPILGYPAIQRERENARLDAERAIVAENTEYCAKWGMPLGTPEYDRCVKDLVNIRGRAEQRVRDEIERENDF
jgi:hypothetical protein